MPILLLIHVLAAIVAVGANVTYAIGSAAGTDRRLGFVIRTVRLRRVANPISSRHHRVAMVLLGAFSFTTG
jgi:hypothetical protein